LADSAGGPSLQGPGDGQDKLGGAPANVACALNRLGTPAAFLGRLGSDAIGEAFEALFAERGVETSGLQWDADRPSRVVLVRRDAHGERSFGGFLGDRGAGFADQALDAKVLQQAAGPLLVRARWLLCGSLPWASPSAASALEGVLAMAKAAGCQPEAGATAGKESSCRQPPFLAVDVNWRPTFWGLPAGTAPPAAVQARMRPLLERAALLKCATEEALWFFASDNPSAISSALPGRPAVCVTDGPAPVRWFLGGRSGQLAPFAIDVVDTTGAGDAFMAGLLHGLCQAEADPHTVVEPEALLRFAAACGSLVCRGAGAIDPQPWAAEVERFLATQGGESTSVADHPAVGPEACSPGAA
jgi:fructokinase